MSIFFPYTAYERYLYQPTPLNISTVSRSLRLHDQPQPITFEYDPTDRSVHRIGQDGSLIPTHNKELFYPDHEVTMVGLTYSDFNYPMNGTPIPFIHEYHSLWLDDALAPLVRHILNPPYIPAIYQAKDKQRVCLDPVQETITLLRTTASGESHPVRVWKGIPVESKLVI